jgi:hypothetical protein
MMGLMASNIIAGLECFAGGQGTGDWKVPRTRRLESLRYCGKLFFGTPPISFAPAQKQIYKNFA